MVQNERVTVFTATELLWVKQQKGGEGRGVKLSPNQISVKPDRYS